MLKMLIYVRSKVYKNVVDLFKILLVKPRIIRLIFKMDFERKKERNKKKGKKEIKFT